VVIERDEGTPQGGPLSPLLANVLLDEVDKDLERRGHAFVRYADDLNVYVRTQRSGERVMTSLRKLFAKLKLRVNETAAPFWITKEEYHEDRIQDRFGCRCARPARYTWRSQSGKGRERARCAIR
jgi:retron-type reverse transcriptase